MLFFQYLAPLSLFTLTDSLPVGHEGPIQFHPLALPLRFACSRVGVGCPNTCWDGGVGLYTHPYGDFSDPHLKPRGTQNALRITNKLAKLL